MPINSPKNSTIRDLKLPEKVIGQQSDSAADEKSLTTINVNMPFSRSSKTVIKQDCDLKDLILRPEHISDIFGTKKQDQQVVTESAGCGKLMKESTGIPTSAKTFSPYNHIAQNHRQHNSKPDGCLTVCNSPKSVNIPVAIVKQKAY